MKALNPTVEIAGTRPRRGGAVLLSVLVGCVLLLSAQAPARNQSGSVLRSWILSVVAPAADAVSALSRAASSALDSAAEMFRATQENARLRERLAARESELFRLRADCRRRRSANACSPRRRPPSRT